MSNHFSVPLARCTSVQLWGWWEEKSVNEDLPHWQGKTIVTVHVHKTFSFFPDSEASWQTIVQLHFFLTLIHILFYWKILTELKNM